MICTKWIEVEQQEQHIPLTVHSGAAFVIEKTCTPMTVVQLRTKIMNYL